MLRQKTVVLTPAIMFAMNSNPFEIIESPGPGYATIITANSFQLRFGSVPYDASGPLYLLYTNDLADFWEAVMFTAAYNQVADYAYWSPDFATYGSPFSLATREDSAMVLMPDPVPWITVGDSTIIVTFFYIVIPIAP